MKGTQLYIARHLTAVICGLIGLELLAIGAHAALDLHTSDEKAVSTEKSASADRLALIIGNGHYPDSAEPLSQPINDASGLADAMRRYGFDVDVVEDATKADMARAVERLRSRIKPGSVVMLFFGGYGVQAGHESYMIPTDATIWKESDVRGGRPRPLGVPSALCRVRFSNRPFEVKHFQTIRHCSIDVAHGLALLFGIGTRALVWGFFCQEVRQCNACLPSSASLFDLKARFFVPTRSRARAVARRGLSRLAGGTNLSICFALARPYLDSFEHDGTLGAVGMTIRGEPAFGRGSIAPQPCIR